MRPIPKRIRQALLAATVLSALAGPAKLQAAAVERLDRILVTTSDLDRAERFYRNGLGFVTIGKAELGGDAFSHLVGIPGAHAKTLTMRLGKEEVTFVRYARAGRPYPRDSASPDLWFQHFAIVVADIDRAYARLKRVGFTPISEGGPVTLPPANGQVRAFKFRDPDGHPLELIYFPPGQGRAVWQARGDAIFLGIDHSAIGISDTARSSDFYTRLLGLAAAYAGVNRGPAQERLDGTFGAVVRITGLRPPAPDGAGVEFLEYLTPATGRPAPREARSNDVAHVELEFEVDDLDALAKALRDAHTPFVSPDIVDLGGGRRAAMVRDPDGHAILLEQGDAK
jgi:catechol 2,3-dioxygenase-like lactoylglutathione lyase family enzyme